MSSTSDPLNKRSSKQPNQSKAPQIFVEDVCGDKNHDKHNQDDADEEKTGLLIVSDHNKQPPHSKDSDDDHDHDQDEIQVEVLNKDSTKKLEKQRLGMSAAKQSFHQQIRRIFIPKEDRQ
jgi:hypothetical protein